MLSPANPKYGTGQKRTEFKKAAGSKTEKRKSPSPLTIRLSEDERARLKQQAAQNGACVSAYVRERLFGRNGNRKHQPSLDRSSLARLLGLLGQSEIARSLSTIADEASNGSLLLDEETHANINTACAHVGLMRDCLIDALGLREAREQ